MKKASGNVFADLGFSAREAENLKVRAMLMAEIERYIRSKKITQKEAAKKFGVTQPRISNVIRGKIDLFSIDMLITMLTHAGLKVDIKVKRARAS